MKNKDKLAEPAHPPAAQSDDFASMLAAFDNDNAVRLEVGQRACGKVFHISKENIFVSLSASQEGVIARAEMTDENGQLQVALGDQVDVFVVSTQDGILLSPKLGREHQGLDMLQRARENNIPIEGTVTGVNTGGLEVSLGVHRGFCPLGQADLNFVADPQQFIGQTLQFLVKELKERGRTIVLSRRAFLQSQRAEQAAQLKKTLAVGQVLTGTVTRTAAFGAFVDLGGIDGLIPIGELSHERTAKVQEIVQIGDSVQVEVRAIDADPKIASGLRIALSRKATLGDPWQTYGQQLVDGAILPGKVVKLEAFGAFVELFPGVQGLVHISEMSNKRIGHPREAVSTGQEVHVRVLQVDKAAGRISLSLKETSEAHVAARALAPGSAVEGTVDRVESYGVMVMLEGGAQALLPAAQTGLPRGTDLRKAFPAGRQLALLITDQDDRGRMRVSLIARERRDEQADLAQYNRSQTLGGLGTLGDLLNKRKT